VITYKERLKQKKLILSFLDEILPRFSGQFLLGTRSLYFQIEYTSKYTPYSDKIFTLNALALVTEAGQMRIRKVIEDLCLYTDHWGF
jgi:hypothetical protein